MILPSLINNGREVPRLRKKRDDQPLCNVYQRWLVRDFVIRIIQLHQIHGWRWDEKVESYEGQESRYYYYDEFFFYFCFHFILLFLPFISIYAFEARKVALFPYGSQFFLYKIWMERHRCFLIGKPYHAFQFGHRRIIRSFLFSWFGKLKLLI